MLHTKLCNTLLHSFVKKLHMKNKVKIGPVQLLAIGFDPKTKFDGKILKELERLDEMKTIRILDLLFVKKDEETSDLVALSIQGEELGAIIGALLGFEFEGNRAKSEQTGIHANSNAFGLSDKQIEQIGQSLEPGMSAGLLLIEHVWARELKQAVRDKGGIPIAEGFLTPEALAKVSIEVDAIAEAMNALEEAEVNEKTRMRAYN